MNVNETFTSNYVFRKSEVYKQRCYVDPFYSSSTQKIEINQSVDFNRSSFFFQDILYESVESDFEFSDKGADFLFSGIFSRNENFPHLNKCKSWFFEKTYYKETLTEEVDYRNLFIYVITSYIQKNIPDQNLILSGI